MINWTVRLRNRDFWLALVPAIILLIGQVLAIFGIELDVTGIEAKACELIASLFIILAILGIVNDPTTATFNDSKRAMGYEEPYE